jgi:hypothetical protein
VYLIAAQRNVRRNHLYPPRLAAKLRVRGDIDLAGPVLTGSNVDVRRIG